MRNLYPNGKPIQSASNRWKTLSLVLGLLVLTNLCWAQVTWTGTTSDNFLVEENWDPAGSPKNQMVTLPLIAYDSLGVLTSPSKRSPVLTSEENITITSLHMVNSAVDSLRRNLTINMGADDTLFISQGGSAGNTINYTTANIVVNSGNVRFNGYERFQENYRNWVINGGTVYVARASRTMQIGNGNNPSSGGQFIINGGKLRVGPGGFGRNFWTRPGGQFVITGSGILEMEGDYSSWSARIESGYVNGGDDYIIKMNYDAVKNLTTFYAMDKSLVFDISNSARQVITAGQVADTLKLLDTKVVTIAKSFIWKYKKLGESNWTNFSGEGATNQRFAPVFAEQGIYNVVCECTLSDNSTMVTNTPVEFFVGSNVFDIYPYSLKPSNFVVQYVRLHETGRELTANITGTPTSLEWKYSKTPNGPYVSFDTPQTTAKIKPKFPSTGNYYIVLEATIGGIAHRSVELYYIVDASNTSNKVITWTGLLGNTNANDPANWYPVANPNRNGLTVNAMENSLYPQFTTSKKDSIGNLWFYAGEINFDGPDTVVITGGDIYAQTVINFKDIVVIHTSTAYFRIPDTTGVVSLYGNSRLEVANSLMMGKGSGASNGGKLHIHDNSVVIAKSWDRVYSVAGAETRVYLYDNATFKLLGDVRSALKGYIEAGNLLCGEEGYEPYVLYDGEYTITKARNINSFSLSDAARTFTTAGYPIASEIGLTNAEGISSWEWKYSTSIYGEWNSFSPAAVNVLTYAPTFSNPGNYYVIAESSTGVKTSNMKLISVVNLSVTPATEQVKAVGSTCDSLFVTIPTEVTLLSGAWFILDAEGNEIETGVKGPAYLPAFFTPGIYEVFYMAEVQDENSVSYSLFSNKVTIYYGADRKVKVGYYSFSKTGMDANAAKPDADPVYTMLKADEKLDVTLELLTDVSVTATTDVSKYDVIVIQESFGGGDKILTPAGALGIAKLTVPTLYNKSYAFKAGRAFATGATGTGAELTASVLHLKVPAANQGNPLFKGMTFAGDSVKVLNIGATDLGANGTKTLNYAKDVVLSNTTTLLAQPVRVAGSDVPVISFNDIPKGTTMGGETTAARMITFGMNFGAICNHNGTNLTSAGITLWRNAVYMLGGLDVPATLVKGNDDGFVGVGQTELSGVNVYPNPARSFVNVDGLNGQSLVKVINAAGQVVFSRSANSPRMTIATEGFNPGVYMLRVESNGKVSSGKFLKQ